MPKTRRLAFAGQIGEAGHGGAFHAFTYPRAPCGPASVARPFPSPFDRRRLEPPESAADAGVRTQTLLLGNVAEPADLDPDAVDAWTDSNVDYALFEGLTLIDEKTTQAVPAAAEGWDVSPDGLVYTFHLRPEGRWSNGDPVTADDFVYSFRRISHAVLRRRVFVHALADQERQGLQ